MAAPTVWFDCSIIIIKYLVFLNCLATVINTHDSKEDALLCRSCGTDVAVADDLLVSMPTKEALHHHNDTILGVNNVLVQLFQNPDGRQFELITTKDASIRKAPETFSQHTWFPGYSWSIGTCQKCGTHLGWVFSKEKDSTESNTDSRATFIGLIIENLLHEHYADSLLMGIPKVYRS